MAGTIERRIECFLDDGTASNKAHEYFKAWFGLLERKVSSGAATRIALQYGSAATGTDHHDGGTPFGDNAFAVYRFAASGARAVPFELLIQFTTSSNFGSSPGNPGQTRSGTGSALGSVGIAFAVGRTGPSTFVSPWNGTTNNDGTDTKGTPVWDVGVGSVYVWPRSNNAGGGHAVNREDTVRIYVPDSSDPARLHIAADEDGISWACDVDDTNDYNVGYFGLVKVRSGTSHEIPLALLYKEALPYVPGISLGGTAGSAGDQGGAWLQDLSAMEGVYMDRWPHVFQITDIPNSGMATPAEFDEFAIPLGFGGPTGGFFGEIEFIRETHNVSTHDTGGSQDRVYLGNGTLGTAKISFSWDGATTPKSGASRDGVDS